jgi:hypothetical protein
MNSTYAVSQAERPVSYTQQREIDTAAGELAAAFAAIGRTVKAALTRRAGASRPLETAAAEDLARIPGDYLIPLRDNELVSAG